jgi:hypothetical protein
MIQLPGTIEFRHGGTSLALGQWATSYALGGLRLLSDTGTPQAERRPGGVLETESAKRTSRRIEHELTGRSRRKIKRRQHTLRQLTLTLLAGLISRPSGQMPDKRMKRVCRLAGRPGH